MADPPAPEVLLIIRFTASIPDLPLPVSCPKTTTTLSLKQLIRTHLPPAHAASRLRLIHAGKVLADAAALTQSLSLPPPPPPRAKPPPGSQHNDAKGKGKAQDDDDTAAPEPRRVYIHCSIGDALSPLALTAEAAAAAEAEAALSAGAALAGKSAAAAAAAGAGASSSNAAAAGGGGTGDHAAAGTSSSSTTQAPRGFDRLLTAGFSPAEVQALRSQFRANLSFTHTPDTMPSAEEIRVMEDRWLDNDGGGGAGPGGGGGTAVTEAGGGGGEDATGGGGGWGTATWSDNGGLDDMLYGNVVGFFWPLGALGWGFREEGVWSRRRQIAVLTGFLLNIIFGFLRLSG